MTIPLALLDVDGVLNLWRLIRHRKFVVSEEEVAFNEYPVARLDFTVRSGRFDCFQQFWRTDLPDLIERLSMTFDLVWATSWNHHANEFWPTKMGLAGPLPVIELENDGKHLARTSWKTAQVNQWLLDNNGPDVVGVWFDDEVSRYDRSYLPQRMLPIHTEAHLGLTPQNIWLAEMHVMGLPTSVRETLDALKVTSWPTGDFDEVLGFLMNRRNSEQFTPSYNPTVSLHRLREAAVEISG